MTYCEIIEWEKIPPQHFSFPDMSGATVVGTCQSSLGTHTVKLKVIPPYRIYSLDDVAFVELEEWSAGYFSVRTASSTIQGKGIVSCFIEYLVRHQHHKLFSDFDMSPAGEKLWMSLVTKGRFNVSVADLKTGEQYPISDIGTTLPDGTVLIAPEDVRGEQPDYNNLDWSKQQRFVYLLESRIGIPKETGKFGRCRVPPSGIIREGAKFDTGM